MRSSPGRSALLGAGGWVLATSLSIACGGGDKTPMATTSAVTAATKTPGTTAQPSAAATSVPATTLWLVAKDTLFDKSELKAKPGDLTIVMDNQDPGIPHNLHVFEGTDSKGQDLGKTEIAPGPAKQTLKLNLTAGDYFVWCDVHSTTASAKLKVE